MKKIILDMLEKVAPVRQVEYNGKIWMLDADNNLQPWALPGAFLLCSYALVRPLEALYRLFAPSPISYHCHTFLALVGRPTAL